MSHFRSTPFKLIGLKLDKKTTNLNEQSMADCGNLWQQFEAGSFAERIPGKTSGDIYAVYFDYDGDHTGSFSYFIGCKVPLDTEAPEGMSHLLVPPSNYKKIVARGKMPDCVANAWRQIWASTLERAYGYDFEVYSERSKDWNNAEVDIFLSCD